MKRYYGFTVLLVSAIPSTRNSYYAYSRFSNSREFFPSPVKRRSPMAKIKEDRRKKIFPKFTGRTAGNEKKSEIALQIATDGFDPRAYKTDSTRFNANRRVREDGRGQKWEGGVWAEVKERKVWDRNLEIRTNS